MKSVYDAENAIDASLAKGILLQTGIHAIAVGGYLQGAVGDIPLTGLVSVLVNDEDEIEARAVIQRWQNGELSLDAENPAESDHHSLPPTGQSFGITVATFLIGAALAGIGVHLWYKTPQFSHGVDTDGDGIADTYLYWQGKYLHREEIDRNQDGEIDLFRHYDSRGILSSWQLDDNFDGVFEVSGRVGRDGRSYTDTDRDGDGVVDTRDHFRYLSIYTMTEYFAEDGRQAVKRYRYQDAGVSYAEIDQDRDGIMETFHLYNDMEEIEMIFDNRAALFEEVVKRQRH
jgi:hypothetical protein